MILAIFITTALLSALYARFLNQKRVHDWYTPDRTYITVVGGNGIILLGFAAVVGWAGLPWWVWWVAFGLNVAAGGPIILWQRIRTAKRRRRATQALWRR